MDLPAYVAAMAALRVAQVAPSAALLAVDPVDLVVQAAPVALAPVAQAVASHGTCRSSDPSLRFRSTVRYLLQVAAVGPEPRLGPGLPIMAEATPAARKVVPIAAPPTARPGISVAPHPDPPTGAVGTFYPITGAPP